MRWIHRLPRFALPGLAVVLGAGAGYAYYHFVGCSSGGCPITANPYLATAYGGIIGGLVAWTPRPRRGDEPGATDDDRGDGDRGDGGEHDAA